jgi:glutaredoxin
MKFVKTYSFVLFAALFVLASCKKEDVTTTDEDNATTENVVVNGVGEGDGDGGGDGETDPGADNTVLVYSAEWCGACTSLKNQLTDAGIEYEVRDVDEPEISSECYNLILEAGYEIDGSYSIPVAKVGDNPVLYGADCTLENIEDQL